MVTAVHSLETANLMQHTEYFTKDAGDIINIILYLCLEENHASALTVQGVWNFDGVQY